MTPRNRSRTPRTRSSPSPEEARHPSGCLFFSQSTTCTNAAGQRVSNRIGRCSDGLDDGEQLRLADAELLCPKAHAVEPSGIDAAYLRGQFEIGMHMDLRQVTAAGFAPRKQSPRHLFRDDVALGSIGLPRLDNACCRVPLASQFCKRQRTAHDPISVGVCLWTHISSSQSISSSARARGVMASLVRPKTSSKAAVAFLLKKSCVPSYASK